MSPQLHGSESGNHKGKVKVSGKEALLAWSFPLHYSQRRLGLYGYCNLLPRLSASIICYIFKIRSTSHETKAILYLPWTSLLSNFALSWMSFRDLQASVSVTKSIIPIPLHTCPCFPPFLVWWPLHLTWLLREIWVNLEATPSRATYRVIVNFKGVNKHVKKYLEQYLV